MFSNNSKWQQTEEYADFAVLEITFKNEQQEKTVTSNYFNNKDNQFKYKKESFLAHPKNIKANEYSLVGFYNNQASQSQNTNNLEITINKQINPNEEEQKTLSNLANSPFYNSYPNIKGAFDPVISLSYYDYEYIENISQNLYKTYIPWGLMYPINYGNLPNFSIGSMMNDSDGYTYGIHFASDQNTSIGLVQALYCEGFDYQGSFGKYNLDGYDLINGGFINQKSHIEIVWSNYMEIKI